MRPPRIVGGGHLGSPLNYVPTPKPVTYGDRLAERRNALATARNTLVRDLLATHGSDPAVWPDATLDKIDRIDGRLRALDLAATAARRANSSWDTTPADRSKS